MKYILLQYAHLIAICKSDLKHDKTYLLRYYCLGLGHFVKVNLLKIKNLMLSNMQCA